MVTVRVFIFLLLISLSFKALPFKEEPIVLPLNDWPSQRLLSKIVGDKIQQLGFPVEYLPMSSTNQLGALRKGFVHIQVETWQTYKYSEFSLAIEHGYIESLGLHSAYGREDWWYPKYVEDLCPGLPDWRALKKCSEIFSDDNHGDKGVYYTGPWNYRDAAMIRSLGLNFAIERLSNAEQLWQKLFQAEKDKKAILLLHWSPNWIDIRMEGSFIEFPEFEPNCEQDPAWGINKKMLYDCGNPIKTQIKKVAWPGVKQKWPCVYQLIKKVNFTREMIAQASSLFGEEQKTEQQAKAIWLAKYEEQSKEWLNFTCPIT
jgi:glycine betaine/proline transport system substrate-binding protein